MEERFIGFLLAVLSSAFIGCSYVITKQGLISSDGHGTGNSYSYLRNKMWWLGMMTMVVGEISNFAAYSFAPAILVTPLGALSVLISSVLASFFLKEKLSAIGKVGCILCLIGSVIIVLQAPAEHPIDSINEIIHSAFSPGFLIYSILSVGVSLWLIYYVAPRHGTRYMSVYISICSLIGSMSVVSSKGLGIAIKLTFGGNNQFIYFSTYACAFIVAVCVVTQVNYLNKALDVFSTALVTPVYYVYFTTATLISSSLLFGGGYQDSSVVSMVTAIAGFIVIFLGVYLLSYDQISSTAARSPDQKELPPFIPLEEQDVIDDDGL